MRSRLLNTLIIAIFLLSIAAPLVPIMTAPVAKIAKAQAAPTISANATRVTYGATVEIIVNVPGATENTIKVNITVNGVLNKDIVFERNDTTDNYIGYLTINSDGTVTYTSLGGYTSEVLNGKLTADGQTIVISMKGAQNSWTIYFYKTLKLIIEGREYPVNSGVFWIPRICNCTVGSVNPYYAYNPWEWYFLAPAATPGEQYNVLIEIDDINGNLVAGPETIVFNATTKGGMTVLIPANDTEAEKITDLLMMASENSLPWYIMGNNFNNVIREGDFLTISATVLGIAGGTQTTSAQLRIFVSIAEIYTEPETLSLNHPDFTIYVADADANFNTLAQETYPFQINIEGNTYTLTETGANTGVFEVKLNLLTSGLYPTIFNENDNKLNWTMQEIRLDNPPSTTYCDRSGAFTIQYHNATVKTAEASVILRQATRCCPVLKLTLQIDDQDVLMGYPSTIPVATKRIYAGMYLTNVTAKYIYYDGNSMTVTDVPAIMFSLYLVGVNETNGTMAVPLEAINSFTLSFYQVGSNMIQAQIPLDQVNWKDANSQLVSQGYNPKYIEVVYYDLFTTSLKIKKIELKVPIQKVDMELDRYELPVTARTLEPTNMYTNITGPEYQVVHITVYDQGANTNCCNINTTSAKTIELTLSKYDARLGKTIIIKSGNGSIAIPLKERLTNGTYSSKIGYCYMNVTDLTETGPNTGVFTGELLIYSVITINGKTYHIPGCPSPWLNGATLTLKYVSPAVGYSERTITFKVEDAKLTVEPSDTAIYGKPITITVNDPDANLDNTVNESIPVVIGVYCPLTGELIAKHVVNLYPEAANSTIYNATIILQKPYVQQPCTQLRIYYIDPTPYDASALNLANQLFDEAVATSNSTELGWLLYYSSNHVPASSDATSFASSAKAVHEVTIFVKPVKGEVSLYYKIRNYINGWVPVSNKVVPAYSGAELLIQINDSDQNIDSNKNTIPGTYVSVTFNGTTKYLGKDFLFNETDNESGIFTANITLGQLLSMFGVTDVKEAVGKTITITYHDPSATCQTGVCGAGTATVSVSFKIVDVTGNVTIINAVTGKEQNNFKCYCVRTQTPGDMITIKVADLDLLDYGQAPIAFSKLFTLYNVKGTSENLATYGNGTANDMLLTYAGYYNVTIDGVPIPIPVYEVTNIRLLCSSFETSLMTSNYIVAPPFTTLKIVYHDPAGKNGTPVDVSKEISISISTITKPEDTATINTSAIDVRVYRNGTYVATTVVMQGEPVTIEAPISYNPLAASMFAGQTFQVLYLVTDSSGHVYAFGYVPVSVSQSGFVTVPLQISSLVTKSLQPGTYKVVIMVVNNLTDLVSLSKPVEVTITVQAA